MTHDEYEKKIQAYKKRMQEIESGKNLNGIKSSNSINFDAESVVETKNRNLQDAVNHFQKNMSSQDELNFVRQKNLQKYEVECKPKKKGISNWSKVLITTTVVLGVLVGSNYAIKESQKIDSINPVAEIINNEIDHSNVPDFYNNLYDEKLLGGKVSEELYSNLNIVSRHTYRTEDGNNYWYDLNGIVNEILDSKINPHINLYAAYSNFNYDADENMNKILKMLSSKSSEGSFFYDVNSFNSYLNKMSISSTKDYHNIMKHLLNLYLDPTKNAEFENLLNNLVNKDGMQQEIMAFNSEGLNK